MSGVLPWSVVISTGIIKATLIGNAWGATIECSGLYWYKNYTHR